MAKEIKTKTTKDNKGLLDEVEKAVDSPVDSAVAPCADGFVDDAMNTPVVDESKSVDGERKEKESVGGPGKIRDYYMSLSREKAKAQSSLGGIRSGESRRIKRDGAKTAKEAALMVLNNTLRSSTVDNLLGEYADLLSDEEKRKDLTAMSVIMARMTYEAAHGNVKAAEFIRDTGGYKPVEQVQVDASVMTDQDRALMDKVSQRLGINPPAAD